MRILLQRLKQEPVLLGTFLCGATIGSFITALLSWLMFLYK